jgi:hypothetical protein
MRRTGGRKLFGKERKEVFLEWFAATCNARLSAEKAGINEKTVYKHLAKDPEFLDGFGRAVQIGYVRLEARELQEAHRFGLGQSGAREEDELGGLHDPPSTIESSFDGPPPRPGEEYEVRCDLDPELVEEHFNPELALQLLREHRRHLPGSAQKRPHQRTTARSATNKEIARDAGQAAGRLCAAGAAGAAPRARRRSDKRRLVSDAVSPLEILIEEEGGSRLWPG